MKKVILSTIVLSLVGLLFVFEASTGESLMLYDYPYHFLRQQSMWLGIGYVLMIAAIFIPPKVWEKTSWGWYIFGIGLLVAVLIPGIGREFNGARRWIGIGTITVLQPIEIVKFTVVVFFANWMSKHQRVLPFLCSIGLPMALVILQPDLGSTLVLAAIGFMMYFLAGGDFKFVAGSLLAGLLVISIVVLTSEYRRDRVITYLDPSKDPLGAGFHVRQMTLALGRGGLLGQGIGNSKQKLAYIPEPSSDSIFAITAEELGFIGSTFIMGFYLLYIKGALEIALSQKKNRFNFLLASGITMWFSIQTLLNLAAVVALVPLTGIPLPLFSYGGSSIVMILFATGILLRLARTKTKTT